MYLKGFRFGILLQLSVGPVCLFVFNAAGKNGFYAALSAVVAVALVDALYIALAGFGVASVLKKERVRRMIRIFGFAVLVLFGINTILSALDITLIPGVRLPSGIGTKSLFWQGILITASNPLTILFWGGVFTTEALTYGMDHKQLSGYGAGCVSATVVSMTVFAGIGSLMSSFLPERMITGLNVAVGLVLILLGVKLITRKPA